MRFPIFKHYAWSFGLNIFALFCLLPFLLLAAYCHPYLDDYEYPQYVRKMGLINHTTSTHLSLSGRFSSSLATGLHPFVIHADESLINYQVYVAGIILLLACSIYGVVMATLAGGPILLRTKLAAGSVILSLFLLWLPNPTEAFYWFISTLSYILPCILEALLLISICLLFTIQQPVTRGIIWSGAFLLAFLIPGFSEITACISLTAMLITLPLLLRRRTIFGWWAIWLASGLGATLMLSAPGNFIRIHQVGVGVIYPPHAVFSATIATFYTLVNWLGTGSIVIVSVLILPFFQRIANTLAAPVLQRLTQYVLVWPLLLVGGIYSSYLLTYLSIDAPPPLRCRNHLYFFFVIIWFISIYGWVAYRLQQGKHVTTVSGGARHLLLLLAVVLLWSDHDVALSRIHLNRGFNTVFTAYRDLLNGSAAHYDQQQQVRYRLLTGPKLDVLLPALTAQCKTIEGRDLSTDPRWWGNQGWAKCFGRRTVRVVIGK
ncbi:hypothetical protein H8B13_15850 [Hymenobacter sp. BT188]|uniref:hypothetical protein n=1 Tax=Hymenobacter sp. BT188 TaxID=2763504 RepID=UPI0016518891|nr:hypothetical protein [Hymenobacter sp. BT188]MBC6608303.1 hypothetical protein [Hymenobacter sp. BT188]